MDIILTTKCNRKCSGCCYLFNKYKEDEFFDPDYIINNVKKVLPAIEKYGNVSIIGGETFLYPELVKIVKYIKTTQVTHIDIFTNGTIYPDYIEELCKIVDNRFHFVIGNYGNKDVIKKLKETFMVNRISHVVRPDDDNWIEHGDFIDHKEPKVQFCNFRYLTLMKDKIYACGRFAQAVNLGLIKLEDMDSEEWVDINDEQVFEKIDMMMEQSFYHFSKTCKYCLRGSKKGLLIPQGD